MPTSTSRYRFEFRLCDWAEKLSVSLCGSRCALFVALREDGTPRRIYFAAPGEGFDGPSKASLAESHPSWLLYQPYEEDGSAYLEWLGLRQEVVERWLGRRLELADFLDVRSTGSRDVWPDAWRVLLA